MPKILLVEDDQFLRDIYRTRLEKEGFEVKEVENGEAAQKALLNEKFDLVLLDLILPGRDGIELLRKLKSEKMINNLKIVVLSNLSEKNQIKLTKEMGVAKYLIKAHSTPSEVVAEIKKLLNI